MFIYLFILPVFIICQAKIATQNNSHQPPVKFQQEGLNWRVVILSLTVLIFKHFRCLRPHLHINWGMCLIIMLSLQSQKVY